MRKENSTNTSNEKALQQFCKASKTLALFSGRWKFSLLYQLLQEPTSYSQFKILLPEVSDRTLSRQLNELIADGLITKDKNKTSSVYSLAKKGHQLAPIFQVLANFSAAD